MSRNRNRFPFNFSQATGKFGRLFLRQAVIYPGEDGYWLAECPSLKGCISQGKTKEEAIRNIRDAIELYISALEDDSLPIPKETFDLLTVVV
jgi:predicted RNase H-like HicB family nuclease